MGKDKENLVEKFKSLSNEERRKIKELMQIKSGDRSGDASHEPSTTSKSKIKAPPKLDDTETLTWMYTKESLDNKEDYLLGKRVDAKSEVSAANRIAPDDLPERIARDSSTSNRVDEVEEQSGGISVDLAAKIREDPLYQIRRMEEQQKRKLLSNPIKMKQLEALVNVGKKKKETSRSKSKRKADKKHSKKKKKKRGRDKVKKRKDSGNSSDSDSSSGSDSDLLARYKEILAQHVKQQRGGGGESGSGSGSGSESNPSDSESSAPDDAGKSGPRRDVRDFMRTMSQYDHGWRQQQTPRSNEGDGQVDAQHRGKRQQRYDDNGGEDRPRDREAGAQTSHDTRNMQRDQDKHHRRDGNRYEQRHEREKADDQYAHERTRSEEKHGYERRRYTDKELEFEKNEARRKFEYDLKRHRNDVEHESKKRQKGSDTKERHISRDEERIDKYEKKREKHQDSGSSSGGGGKRESRKEEHSGRKQKSGDNVEYKRQRSDSGDGNKRSRRKSPAKQRHDSDSDDGGMKRSYGLILPASKRQDVACTAAKRSDKDAAPSNRAPAKANTSPPQSAAAVAPVRSKPKRKLTAEEREQRLREMMENARQADTEREEKVGRHEEEARREERLTLEGGRAHEFIRPMLSSATSSGSVEDRIKRNIHSVQRTRSALDKPFHKR